MVRAVENESFRIPCEPKLSRRIRFVVPELSARRKMLLPLLGFLISPRLNVVPKLLRRSNEALLYLRSNEALLYLRSIDTELSRRFKFDAALFRRGIVWAVYCSGLFVGVPALFLKSICD